MSESPEEGPRGRWKWGSGAVGKAWSGQVEEAIRASSPQTERSTKVRFLVLGL